MVACGGQCSFLTAIIIVFFPLSYFLCGLGIPGKENQEFAIYGRQMKGLHFSGVHVSVSEARVRDPNGEEPADISGAGFVISMPQSHTFPSELITTLSTWFPPGRLLAEITDDPVLS